MSALDERREKLLAPLLALAVLVLVPAPWEADPALDFAEQAASAGFFN